MLKQADIASIGPVARILPILAVENIGNIRQELADRATQFVKGQDYFAHVLSKVGDTAYNVKVESGSLKGTLLKMDLGLAAKAGQLITLRYMHDSPVPTFLLTATPSNVAGSKTELSTAANLIGHYLKQAESEGVTSRFQATAVVTNNPGKPQVLAHDLKNAVSKSGLFYESHLSDLAQSNQSLAALKQEPQNQANSPIANLMSQQLAILEHQRMSWQGEVWPGQKMDWDIYQQSSDDGNQSANDSESDQKQSISSEMTLHFPHLGKVSARISLVDGRMRVNILADQPETLEMLKAKRLSLAESISKNGQQLDALTVERDE
ncbi:MAG: flagellar hook-length control protein FliK [Methylotenera sp.]|uniref:flagellar hook-length control protein FliK n=1 Tax=Methylotenera sp. TaxID=2051956 RepID=UPI0024890C36|nr:flagellar hook-length control protein FliK [Methylotenera sp.]MDI1308502.1 flagellar hook-length control protein FliK [Methylotenera sp.]